ncbi:MAG TPA: hypothetical protein VIL20_28070 [Sandaracinaceae bacterium]
MSRAPAALGLLVAAACGPQTLGDLPRPALVVTVTEPGGFCSATYAVDADDRVWLESGCASSSGLRLQQRTVSEDERAELDALMDRVLALPDDPSCTVPSPSARRYRFVRTTPGGDDWPEKRVCEPGVDPDASALAERMRELAVGPADAGRG